MDGLPESDAIVADPVIENGDLCLSMMSEMERLSFARYGDEIQANVRRNADVLDRGRSIVELRGADLGKSDVATVIAGGPSIKRQEPIPAMKAAGYAGAYVTTDCGIYNCLRNGVIPDLAVTLDPHPTRIIRWFGDPEMSAERLRSKDYFERNDLGDGAVRNLLRINGEVMELLAEFGPRIKIALCTSASKKLVDRCIETGMQIFWWNPMMDDPDEPGSVTNQLMELNGLPAINAGGNVGTAAWMMADAVLGKKHVALTGIDFGYYDETPYDQTQYYYEVLDAVGETALDRMFPRIYNPYMKAWYYTDPAYMWYRQVFLEMVQDAECKTYNCTEGGILFGDGIEFLSLKTFLERGL